MQFFFGGKDVTHMVKPDETGFVVSTKKFGDPQRNVYKYLSIVYKGKCVVIAENDKIDNLATVFETVPVSRQFAAVDHLLRHKKGYELITHPDSSIASLRLCTGSRQTCNSVKVTEDELLTVLQSLAPASCEYICFTLANPALASSVFETVNRILPEHGISVLLLPIRDIDDHTKLLRFVTDMLNLSEFETIYLQRTLQHQVIISKKRTALSLQPQVGESERKLKSSDENDTTLFPQSQVDELDRKHNDDDHESDAKMLVGMGFKRCPSCGAGYEKDNGCNFLYCGLTSDGVFRRGFGCGRSFCSACGLKLCGLHYDSETGKQLPTMRAQHDAVCCTLEQGFSQNDYCPGGHNSHCAKRW